MRRRAALGLAGMGLAATAGCLSWTPVGETNSLPYDARGHINGLELHDGPGDPGEATVLAEYRNDGRREISGGARGDRRERLERLLPGEAPVTVSADANDRLREAFPGFTYRIDLQVMEPKDGGGDGGSGGGDGDYDGYPYHVTRDLFNVATLGESVDVSLADRVDGAGFRDGEIPLDPTLDTITAIYPVSE